jgi:hypothetical protein
VPNANALDLASKPSLRDCANWHLAAKAPGTWFDFEEPARAFDCGFSQRGILATLLVH